MEEKYYDFKKQLVHWGIKYRLEDWELELYGGDNRARQYYKNVLAEDENLQAMLVIDIAMDDIDIKDVIEERACIRWAEGLPYDLVSAAKCHVQGVRL